LINTANAISFSAPKSGLGAHDISFETVSTRLAAIQLSTTHAVGKLRFHQMLSCYAIEQAQRFKKLCEKKPPGYVCGPFGDASEYFVDYQISLVEGLKDVNAIDSIPTVISRHVSDVVRP
jgi:hypothetical protein